MAESAFTIGRLARMAGVGVETVRYYQRRGLLAVPEAKGAFRHYPASAVGRIRFIRRAQELGFRLDEIGELLALDEGGNRTAIRRIASDRLAQIKAKIADLERMRAALSELVDCCMNTAQDRPCPIIAALGGRE